MDPSYLVYIPVSLCECLKEIAAITMPCDTMPDLRLADVWGTVQVNSGYYRITFPKLKHVIGWVFPRRLPFSFA